MTASDLESIETSIGLKFAGGTLGDIITAALPLLFYIAGIALLMYLISGGYKLMLSGGDPKKIEEGKQAITNALFGFLLVFGAYWIARLVSIILSVDIGL